MENINKNDEYNYVCHEIMENNGNKLLLLEDCNIITGVTTDEIKKIFPTFENNIETLAQTYVILLESGDIMYD